MTFTFTGGLESHESTDVSKGQIPGVIFCLDEEGDCERPDTVYAVYQLSDSCLTLRASVMSTCGLPPHPIEIISNSSRSRYVDQLHLLVASYAMVLCFISFQASIRPVLRSQGAR